jgi:hypothetical protein
VARCATATPRSSEEPGASRRKVERRVAEVDKHGRREGCSLPASIPYSGPTSGQRPATGACLRYRTSPRSTERARAGSWSSRR